jgi:hypothetical protein
MRRCIFPKVAAFFAVAMFWIPAVAQNQAGSTGGTIGKIDKSASGGQEAKPAERPLPRSTGIVAHSAISVSGTWHWRAQCGVIAPGGVFEIGEMSGKQFSGAFRSDGPGVLSGEISGDRVTFRRVVDSGWDSPQTWTGRLDHGRIQGDITRPLGHCTFEATK